MKENEIIKYCPKCNEELFKGTEKQAKGKIIYCTRCWRENENKS